MHPEEKTEQKEWYAIAMWCTEDIHEARERKGLPKLSEAEAEAWLSVREDKIKDGMIEQVWEVIEAFLAEENNNA